MTLSVEELNKKFPLNSLYKMTPHGLSLYTQQYISKFLDEESKENPCWDGYKQLGMKDKNGKKVPNCVKEETEDEKKKFKSKSEIEVNPEANVGIDAN